ncbi:hypothetical protein CBF23_013245 [Marinomonas agarivorans]|nr:hypothetical protein CBF23_013245 [Marinomonas agarivorans]
MLIRLWQRHQISLFFLGGILISFATLTPLTELPAQAPGSDKLHHIVGFGVWTLMVAAGNQKRMQYLCLAIFIWGGAIELIQPYVNRYGEWLDFIANTAGILLVYGITRLVKARYKE